MLKNRIKLLPQAAPALALAVLVVVAVSCDTGSGSSSGLKYDARYAVYTTTRSKNFPLPPLTGSQIAGIEPVRGGDWLTVTAGATGGDGTPTVNVTLSEWRNVVAAGGNIDRSQIKDTTASVIVVADNGTRLWFVVNQAHTGENHLLGAPPAGPFAQDWENNDTVMLVKNGNDLTPVSLPWSHSAYNITFSTDMRFDVKKIDGWEMAFYLFNGDPKTKQLFNYFGLYNKYTGQLRVFYYQFDNPGSAGELSILATPNPRSSSKTPYYHSWLYGIPVNHTNVNTKPNPFNVSDNLSETFQTVVTPYSAGQKMVLNIGWYAFDLDFSAWAPGQAFTGNEGLQLIGQTQNKQDITLDGTIKASIDGTFDYTYTAPTAPQSTPSGVLGWFSDIMGGSTGNAGLAKVIGDIASSNYAAAIADGIGAGLNIAAKHDTTQTPGTPGAGNGNIALDLTGTISLKGYISGASSNAYMSTGFEYTNPGDDSLQTMQPGVWSLQTDPVVCIVKDMVIVKTAAYETKSGATGERPGNTFVLGFTGDPVLDVFMTNWDEYHDYVMPRMAYFLDPSSIKINLNTAVYTNIEDVNVSWLVGVYPNQPAGHSNTIRTTIGNISKVGNLEGKDDAWFSDLAFGNNFPTQVVKSREELLSPDIETVAADCKLWEVPFSGYTASMIIPSSDGITLERGQGCNIDYYGYALPNADASSTQKPLTASDLFIVDPQVGFPHFNVLQRIEPLGTSSTNLHDFSGAIPPDFVVWVMLTFTYDDANGVKQQGVFSKRFLPDIKVITKNDLTGSYKTNITNYINSTTGGNNATIQTLPGNIAVKHKDNGKMLFKIRKIIDKIEHP